MTKPHPTCTNCGTSLSYERRALEAGGEEGDSGRDEQQAPLVGAPACQPACGQAARYAASM